jgi:hypothetical protein
MDTDASQPNGNELSTVEASESLMDIAPSSSNISEEDKGTADAGLDVAQEKEQTASVPAADAGIESVNANASDEKALETVAVEEIAPTPALESESELASPLVPTTEETGVTLDSTEVPLKIETTEQTLEETVPREEGQPQDIKTEQADGDEEEDMNEDSDDFATPPVGEQNITAEAVVATETAINKPESVTNTPAEAITAPPTAPASHTANDEAATNFLKQTFDSFSRNSAAASSRTNAHDPEEYRTSLKKRVERDRRDGEAWLALINDASIRADLQDIRSVYEDFFAVFPNAVRSCLVGGVAQVLR